MTKGEPPMFPVGGGPMMGGPVGYGPPIGPMGPMPHPGYGPPSGGGWNHEGGDGGRFNWRRGGGPRGRGWGRGGRPPSKTPCRHFLKGGCRNGDECGFAHTMP
ncbi:serine/threonine-protein phosphatase 1 regulatory subunit 10-like [Hyalella azteca]|nr:serine/threonine-protein phosphatase 1 regulatory subunit 10-like [Hyalella azteca]